jgi:hypothetical protein
MSFFILLREACPGQRCVIAQVQRTKANLRIPEKSTGTGFREGRLGAGRGALRKILKITKDIEKIVFFRWIPLSRDDDCPAMVHSSCPS